MVGNVLDRCATTAAYQEFGLTAVDSLKGWPSNLTDNIRKAQILSVHIADGS